jgi:glycerol-3-phosphate acyltransferase PlsY
MLRAVPTAVEGAVPPAPRIEARVTFASLVILGYLLGSCPWGYWLVRLFRHEDIRTQGSGNVGASNVWRVYGRRLGIPVVTLDVVKAFVPAYLGVHEVSYLCGVVAGSAAMLGHWRPLFLGFKRGGKMVACGGGAMIAIAPWVALIASVIWLVVFLATRYASVASMAAGIPLPVVAYLLGYPISVVVFLTVGTAAVIVLHRPNLRRLRAGTETRFELHRPAGT